MASSAKTSATSSRRWRVNRLAVEIVPAGQWPDEGAWWRTRTANERFSYMEQLRQVNYGGKPVASRLQRVLEVVAWRPR